MNTACSWDEPPSNIPSDRWQMLSNLYDSPSDIDLFTGGLAEDVEDEANIGATFGCIIGRQFNALKFGDRFFFTHNSDSSVSRNNTVSNPNPFTNDQLSILRERHLGDIICDNAVAISETRDNVFRYNSPLEQCPESSSLDICSFVDCQRNKQRGMCLSDLYPIKFCWW